MFRFLSGAALSAILCHLLWKNPEWAERALAVGRKQLAVAAENVQTLARGEEPHDEENGDETDPDPHRVRAFAQSMKGLSHDELWAVMEDSDFDRRAAAARVLLRRAGIPAASEGVQAIQHKCLSSDRPEHLMAGYSYLGLLAYHGVPDTELVPLAQGFVERHPRDRVCDNAVWALGEIGTEETVQYLFEIIHNPRKYGPAARERAFCCLAQCGRYSPARRLEMVPDFIGVYETSRDPQTRAWAMQALARCAPGARASSIDEWRRWWARR